LLTINGLRRRGYTADAINNLCDLVGVSRNTNTIEMQLLEHCARSNLDDISRRAMVVIRPLKVELINYPVGKVEEVEALNFPKDRTMRKVPFSRIVYIDRDDFRMKDEKGYYGLAPDKIVHLKGAYNIKCVDVKTDKRGEPVELKCTVDLESKDKVKGNIQWVAEPRPNESPLRVEVRLYDRLFKSENPSGLGKAWLEDLNPKSLEVLTHAFADPSLAKVKVGDHFQFERLGFFVVDPDSARAGHLVFNLTVRLKDGDKKKGGESKSKTGESKEKKSGGESKRTGESKEKKGEQ